MAIETNMIKRKDFLANEVMDLSAEIALTSPTDTPFTTLVMGRGAVVPAKDITVTWREKKLNEDRGTLILEGAEAGKPIKSTRGSLSNLCQIIEKVTQVSGTAQALNPLGIGNSFDAEVADRLVETKRDLEWYYLNGTKAEENDSTPRQMNGIINLIASGNSVDATEGLTEDMFLDALQKMWDHGAQGEYFGFVNASVKRLINKLAKQGENIRFVKGDEGIGNRFGVSYNRFESDFGILNLVLDRHMGTDNILIVDMEQVEIAELRPTFYEDLPKSGDYFKGHIINESTIKLLNSYAAAKIVNISKLAEGTSGSSAGATTVTISGTPTVKLAAGSEVKISEESKVGLAEGAEVKLAADSEVKLAEGTEVGIKQGSKVGIEGTVTTTSGDV